MASMLRSWIASTAHDEFQSALAWLHTNHSSGAEKIGDEVQYRSGKLWIRVRQPKHVQLVEFISPHKAPFNAIISDGESSIRASFSEASTKIFEKKHDRKFNVLTRGGICKITDFHFVINPRSHLSRRLTLDVVSFQLLGSEGSAICGHPSDIKLEPNIGDVLGKILALLPTLELKDPNRSLLHSNRSSPFPLSPSEENVDSSSSYVLSTQLPLKPDTTVLSASNGGHQRQEELLSLLKGRPNQPKDHSVLYVKNDLSGLHNDIPEVALVQSSPRSQIGGISEVSEIRASGGKLAADCIGSRNKEIQTSKYANNQHDRESGQDNRITQDTQNELQENEKNEAREDAGSRLSANEVELGEPTAAKKSHLALKTRVKYPPERNIFEGLKRIPRNYVRIPKDQKRLLDDNSSWIHHQVEGIEGRASRLNLPPKVLDALINFHSDASEIHSWDTNTKGDESESEENSDADEGSPRELGNDTQRLKAVDTVTEAEYENDSKELHNISHNSISRNRSPKSPASQTTQKSPNISYTTPMQDETTSDQRDPSWSPSPIEHLKPTVRGEIYDIQVSHSSPAQYLSKEVRVSEPIKEVVGSSSQIRIHDTNTDLDKTQIAISHSLATDNTGATFNSNASKPGTKMDNDARPQYKLPSTPPIRSSEISSDEDEMELAVPFAVNDPFESNNTYTSKIRSASQPRSLSSSQKLPRVEVEQTPFGGHSRVTPRRRLFNAIDHCSDPGQKPSSGDIFSDPLIPCTFTDHPINSHAQPNWPSIESTQSESADIAITQNHRSQHSPIDEEETETYRARSRHSMAIIASPQLETKVLDNAIPEMQSLNSPEEESVENFSLSNGSLPSAAHELCSTDEKSVSESYDTNSPTYYGKRSNEESLKENYPGPLKRRRVMKARELDFSSQEQITQDASELARVNRLNFFKGLSTGDNHIGSTSPDTYPTIVQNTQAINLPNPESDTILKGVSSTGVSNPIRERSTSRSNPKAEILDYRKLHENEVPRPQGTGFAVTSSIEADTPNESQSGMNSVEQNLLERYKSTYPTFPPNELSILRACVYLEWLIGEKKAPHPYLWDDFIRANRTQYVQYLDDLPEEETDSRLTGLEFYNKEISSPIFLSRVITPENLENALSIYPQETDTLRSKFLSRSESSKQSSRKEPCSSSSPPQETEVENREDMCEDKIHGESSRNSGRVQRKAFFETPSQLIAQNSRIGSSSQDKRVQERSNSTSSRKFPWTGTTAPSPEASARATSVAPNSLSPSRRSKTLLKRDQVASHKSIQDSPGLDNTGNLASSPVQNKRHDRSLSPGSARSSLGAEQLAKPKHASRMTVSLPHHDAAKRKDPADSTDQRHGQTKSKASTRQELNEARSDRDHRFSASKTLGPEAQKEISSFRNFISSGKFKRRSLGLRSSTQGSIPDSTSKSSVTKRHSTQAEPDTQAWEYE
ncbi:hypothetical protein F5884DRAFT_873153 [Xylogone sp. PMI_703]|nr:hypothetical protein F5884DRAFT_873153 [Xylogone sp. PMI_703]